MNVNKIVTLREVHHQMIDQMILNPKITNKELGEMFGFSAVWACVIKRSEVFKTALESRRAEIVNPIMLLELQDRMKGMVDRAMDILDDKLNLDSKDVNDNLLLRSLEIGIKAIGMGNQNPEIKVDMGHLENLANRLIALHDQIPIRKRVTIDNEMVDVETDELKQVA